jgi:tetratricopeptide (TPR) repeat protein
MVYYYRGSSKLKTSDYSGAIADLDMSLAYNANNQGDASILKTVYYNRGLANYFLGNYSLACNDFQKSMNAGLSTPESVDFIKQVCK